ncbi:hypothetical protein [Yinghuangia sp. YIM S09857]|uniref:hypothetical protein n=1 Tax=Yinghuangia sp. YIM S09857 TaxID=3436929 RepID=UPI003F52FF91
MRGWSVRARVGAVVAAVVVAVGAAGCGSETTSGGGGGDVAGTVLSQAKQQLQDSSTARISLHVGDATAMGVPGAMTADGVMDLAAIKGRLTYHYESLGKSVEMLILPDAVYAKLPEPKDGKTWTRFEGMSGKSVFNGLDRDSVSEALDSLGSAISDAGKDDGSTERSFSETITLDELRDQMGASDDAPLIRTLESMDVKSMTVEFGMTADNKLTRMSVSYGDAMSVKFTDFGTPMGDLTPPSADDVATQSPPRF